MKKRESAADQLYKGRNRRLANEWEQMDKRYGYHPRISFIVERFNESRLPVEYRVQYCIPSFCGVLNVDRVNQLGVNNPPIIANLFQMLVTLPDNYPCADGSPKYCFTSTDPLGQDIPMPWHPNIRYFGLMAGRVCLNVTDTYAYIADCVHRIGRYLTYEIYHAEDFPPYPEDLVVARWVREQAEPNHWIPPKLRMPKI